MNEIKTQLLHLVQANARHQVLPMDLDVYRERLAALKRHTPQLRMTKQERPSLTYTQWIDVRNRLEDWRDTRMRYATP